MPAVSTLIGAGDDGRIRPGFGRALRLVLLLALPPAAAGMAFAPELVTLAYGSRFDGAEDPSSSPSAFVPIAADHRAQHRTAGGNRASVADRSGRHLRLWWTSGSRSCSSRATAPSVQRSRTERASSRSACPSSRTPGGRSGGVDWQPRDRRPAGVLSRSVGRPGSVGRCVELRAAASGGCWQALAVGTGSSSSPASWLLRIISPEDAALARRRRGRHARRHRRRR